MSGVTSNPIDYGLDHLTAIAFNESQQKNNFYNGQNNRIAQTAVLDNYQDEILPLMNVNQALRVEVEDLQLADMVGDYGILNRRAIDARLQKMALRILMGSLSEFNGFAVAYGDVDGLKLINGIDEADKGHDMGDAAIVNVAEHMAQVRPSHDIIARVGGDEFVALMPASSEDEARMLMVGSDGRHGYIPRTQEAVALGRESLVEHFGERWVKDSAEKKPGNVTMGWMFLSRDQFISLFKKWQQDKANLKPGVGDFTTYVFGDADKAMFNNKT